MKENKIYKLLKTLSIGEINLLGKVIKESNYVIKPDIKMLYKILSRQYPDFDNTQSGKEKIFKKLHSNRPYNDLKLRRNFSDLTKIIIDFLNFNTINKDEWQKGKSLSDTYEKAELYELAQKKRQQLHFFLDKDTMKNDKYWKKKMTLYKMEYASTNPNKIRLIILNGVMKRHYSKFIEYRV